MSQLSLSRRGLMSALPSSSLVGLGGAVEEKRTILSTRRATETQIRRPEFGRLSPDIYYPKWFEGEWLASSLATSVEAPLGIDLFGGQNAMASARRELENAVNYTVRFFRETKNDGIVADRPYNTKALVTATLGTRGTLSGLPSSQGFDPNDLRFTLDFGGTAFEARLRTVARLYEEDTFIFRTSELIRQSVSATANPLALPSIKDIETICIYTYNPIDNSISCDQRTATWLFPSDQAAALKEAAANGYAIDLRTYAVSYSRLPPTVASTTSNTITV